MSICYPFFGVQMQASQGVYHVPGNYHGRFSNFTFLDGHVDRHRWVSASFNNPSYSGDYHKVHVTGVPDTASKPDMIWLSQHASVRR